MLKKGNTGVVKRHMVADYLNVGTESAAQYVLMGTGFTKLEESPGAKKSTKKYVNDEASTSRITGYETSFPFDSDLIKEEKAVAALYEVGRNHYTGTDAEFEFVRAELWKPVEGNSNEFAARKFVVSAEISKMDGEDEMQVSGTLNAVGDFIDGTFNTETKMFTKAGGGSGVTLPA